MKGLFLFLISVFSFLLSPHVNADDAQVRLGMEAGSAYVWRGITVVDGISLQPFTEITVDCFHITTRGYIDVENHSDIDDEGLLHEGDMELRCEIRSDSFVYNLGYSQYLNSKVNGANEELSILAGFYPVDYLSCSGELYYEIGELEDFYGRIKIACDFTLGDSIDGALSSSIAAAGKDVTLGGNTGLHDYLIELTMIHEKDSSLETGCTLAYTGTLDEDVLPEQPVDFYLSLFAIYTF